MAVYGKRAPAALTQEDGEISKDRAKKIACYECRKAKVRCIIDGQSEQKCRRCCRHHLDCFFVPHRRGRQKLSHRLDAETYLDHLALGFKNFPVPEGDALFYSPMITRILLSYVESKSGQKSLVMTWMLIACRARDLGLMAHVLRLACDSNLPLSEVVFDEAFMAEVQVRTSLAEDKMPRAIHDIYISNKLSIVRASIHGRCKFFPSSAFALEIGSEVALKARQPERKKCSMNILAYTETLICFAVRPCHRSKVVKYTSSLWTQVDFKNRSVEDDYAKIIYQSFPDTIDVECAPSRVDAGVRILKCRMCGSVTYSENGTVWMCIEFTPQREEETSDCCTAQHVDAFPYAQMPSLLYQDTQSLHQTNQLLPSQEPCFFIT